MKRKIYGYLRVSTPGQDTAKNEHDVLKYANDHLGGGKVEMIHDTVSGTKTWKKRKLAGLVERMNAGDILIVPELSRLGRSLIDVLDVLNVLTEASVKVYSVKENFQLNGGDMQSKIMRSMIALFAELERDLISQRTKEGLAAARAQGRTGGRPRGIGKSRLDAHRDSIIEQIKLGVTRKRIADNFEVTPAALGNWINKHKIRV